MSLKLCDRNHAVDVVRVFALICVIFTHAVESSFDFSGDTLVIGNTAYVVIANSLRILGRLGVPMFVMLSGYLLLDRRYDYESTIRFYKRNLIGLLITTEIWLIIYFFFCRVLYNIPFSIIELVREILFLRKSESTHLWYMGEILGMYFFIPVISRAVELVERRILFFIVVISSMFVFVVPSINILLSLMNKEYLEVQLNVLFSGGWTGIYLICGYMVKKDYFRAIKKEILVITAIVSYVLAVVIVTECYRWGIKYLAWYDFLPIAITSWSVFLLLFRKNFKLRGMIISWLGYSSFGVYLVHDLIRKILERHVFYDATIGSSLLRLLIIFTVVTLVSESIVRIVSNCKKLSRVLFFMR